jgi:hypothetical protein
MTEGQRGFVLCEEGNCIEGAPLLKAACDSGILMYASIYADICLRNLDGRNHSKEEAAFYYLLAFDYGDGDIWAYLNSLDARLIDMTIDKPTRIALLVRIWKGNE